MRTVTGMQGTGGARELAELLRQMGRGQDTMLAHITPEEAEMLLQAGGSGTVNPETGLPEFQPVYDYEFEAYGPGADRTPSPAMSNEIYGFGYGQEGEFGVAPGMGTAPPDVSRYQQMPSLDMFQRQYEPPDVLLAREQADQARTEFIPPTEGRGFPRAPFLQPAPTPPGVSDRIAQTIKESPNLRQMLATGATSLVSLLNAARMRREGRRSAEELRQLGAPIRAEAENLRRQALGGGLTPQQARQMEAQRARMLQSGAQRGVTSGTQQAMIENQLSRQRAELGQTNLENALRQLGVANAYDEQAIRAKLASDRDTAAALEDVLGNLIRSYAGVQQQPTRPRGETPLPTNQMATVNPRDQLRSQSQGR
jgi:hypothetical protein